MAVYVFQHTALEPPARLGQVLRDEGHRLKVLRLDQGDALPPDLDDVDGVISLGGPMNVDERSAYPWMEPQMTLLAAAHEAGLPVVGVCLGAQLIATALGGRVAPMPAAEIGWHDLRLAFPGTLDPIFTGLPWRHTQFHLHDQEVVELPASATALAGSSMCRHQAFKVGLKTYGFQFHFECDRARIEALLDGHQQWTGEGQGDVEAIREQTDTFYRVYRHLGDRLAQNIATLLMPLERRLPGPRGPAANWDPSIS